MQGERLAWLIALVLGLGAVGVLGVTVGLGADPHTGALGVVLATLLVPVAVFFAALGGGLRWRRLRRERKERSV